MDGKLEMIEGPVEVAHMQKERIPHDPKWITPPGSDNLITFVSGTDLDPSGSSEGALSELHDMLGWGMRYHFQLEHGDGLSKDEWIEMLKRQRECDLDAFRAERHEKDKLMLRIRELKARVRKVKSRNRKLKARIRELKDDLGYQEEMEQ